LAIARKTWFIRLILGAKKVKLTTVVIIVLLLQQLTACQADNSKDHSSIPLWQLADNSSPCSKTVDNIRYYGLNINWEIFKEAFNEQYSLLLPNSRQIKVISSAVKDDVGGLKNITLTLEGNTKAVLSINERAIFGRVDAGRLIYSLTTDDGCNQLFSYEASGKKRLVNPNDTYIRPLPDSKNLMEPGS